MVILDLEYQKLYFLSHINSIHNDKILKGKTANEIYKNISPNSSDNFDIFYCVFEYSHDYVKAEEEIETYLIMNDDKFENKETNIKNQTSENIKNSDCFTLSCVNVVVQFQTKFAKEKYSKDHETAIETIVYDKTKEIISTGEGKQYYDLIPVFKKADKFGRWSLDPLFGHLKIYLVMGDKNIFFPTTWNIIKNETKLNFLKEDVYLENFKSLIAKNKINTKQLYGFFTEVLKYDKFEVSQVLERLKALCIYTLNDLQKLSDDGWKILFSQMPARTEEIREAVDKLDNEDSDSLVTKQMRDESEQMADWHRFERYIFHKSHMFVKLKKTGYLSKDALDKSFEKEKNVKSFTVDPKLFDQLYERFSMFSIAEEQDIRLTRGMLFYGPPGTGKTKLMELVIRISGLAKYIEPFGSSELNRGLVGETEALLRDIFRRASYFPSIIFCIAIDEIDSLVPKRESNKENASKKDIVNQLLALIEGASNIKNVYLIGATNHLSKIDKAFARRMQDKFYVGYLNINERLQLIKSVDNDFIDKSDKIIFEKDIDNLIEIITINFTGAAASELKSKIKAEYFLKKNFKLNKHTLCKLANEIIKSHDVKLGGLSIPELFSNITNKEIRERIEYWDKHYKELENCTGRVTINLDAEVKSIQFELNNELELLEIPLQDIDFIKNIVPIILYFMIYLKINLVKLIDSNFLKQSLGDDDNSSAGANSIINFYDEFKEYTDGILVVNGDEIIGVSESGSIETGYDRSRYTSSIVDQTIWIKAMNTIFSNKEKVREYEFPKKWYFFVTASKFLNDSFKASFKFPLTVKEKKDKKLEEENRMTENTCLNCQRKYIEDDNRIDSCCYHPYMLIHKQSRRAMTKEQVINMARDMLDQEITKEYIYFCCLKVYDAEGCTKDKHSNTDQKKEKEFEKKIKSTWISDDRKLLFYNKNNHEWTTNQNSETFIKIEEKYDEIIIQNKQKSHYYKLNSYCASYGATNSTNQENLICFGQWDYKT